MADESQGTTVALAEVGEQVAPLTSRTPTVYVPRRFRIGGIEGIRPGTAIVGTPQGDGMVAIDVQSTPYVEPTPECWSTWVIEAAHRHCTERETLLTEGFEPETKMVSEAALVEVGHCFEGKVLIDRPEQGAALSRWLQAGRADHVIEKPFPHES
jgi:hypothetical protein